MKCQACGFEEGPEVETVEVLFTRGKRKGEVSHTEERETHNPQWMRLGVERGFDFQKIPSGRRYWRGEPEYISLSACPICLTVRAH